MENDLDSLLEIITSPLMIFFVLLLVFTLIYAIRESKPGLTGDKKQARNRKIRAEYGKKY